MIFKFDARSYQLVRACLLIASLTFGSAAALGQSSCPDPPVPSIKSSDVPNDVCIPSGFPQNQNPIRFFDDYSWRAFVAMVWPAANGQRGKPDTTKTVGDTGPRVFETLKSVWEIFHNDGSTPAPWNVYDAAHFNACNAAASFGDVVLASFSKFSDLGQAGVGSLVGPLIAQNRTYTRYLTGFNEIEFDQISNDKLYLRSNLPMKGPFGDGALDVKSAWILMTNIPHHERYYIRPALVLNPETGQCSKVDIGLVGLHIVQKTPTRPQWIWSTFEHVDNVPPAVPGGSGTFNFNDGTRRAMPKTNPYPIDPLILPTPVPFNVQRLTRINNSTRNTNTVYRNLLKGVGSKWQFYQLVMTQWPLQPSQPNIPGTPDNTFPGSADSSSAFANVTMETFDQTIIRRGCMSCHDATRSKTDFLWSLNDHASPPNIPNFLFDPSLRELQTLLRLTAPKTRKNRTR
jgi:hypothetical protein